MKKVGKRSEWGKVVVVWPEPIKRAMRRPKRANAEEPIKSTDVAPWKNWSRLENPSRHLRNLRMLVEELDRRKSRAARRVAQQVRAVLSGLQTGRKTGGENTGRHMRLQGDRMQKAVRAEAERLRRKGWAEHNLASGVSQALGKKGIALSVSQARRHLGPRRKRA